MTKSHLLFTFLALSSLQVLTFAQNHGFLSPDPPAIPENDVATNTNASFTVVGNTADEIGTAVTNALDLIFRIIIGSSDNIGNNVAANISQSLQQQNPSMSDVQATALATQVGQIVNESIRNLNESSQNVSNSVGNLVRDSVVAFRDARDRGGNAGAAVGIVVGNAVRGLNNTADDIGDTIEDALDDAVDSIDNLPNQFEDVAGDLAEAIGQAVENLLTETSAGANTVQFIVANAINNGINQSEPRNTSQEIGNSVNTLAFVIRSSSGAIANAIAYSTSNAIAGEVEGVTQRDVELIRQMIKDEVDRTIKNININSTDLSESINFAINWDLQVRGDNTVSVSEVINIFGQIIAIGVANSLTNQRSS